MQCLKCDIELKSIDIIKGVAIIGKNYFCLNCSYEMDTKEKPMRYKSYYKNGKSY